MSVSPGQTTETTAIRLSAYMSSRALATTTTSSFLIILWRPFQRNVLSGDPKFIKTRSEGVKRSYIHAKCGVIYLQMSNAYLNNEI